MANAHFARLAAAAVERNEQASDQYDVAAFALWHALSGAQQEVLRQLVESGPVYDGDVASKSARDDLTQLGLANRACMKGEQGFTVANYIGWDVLRAGGWHPNGKAVAHV